MNIDFTRQWLSTFHDILPKGLCDALDAIHQNALLLIERYSGLYDVSATDVLSSMNLQAILPPLISLLTIYFALLSLYRTTSFFVRSTIFFVKWGAMIGAVAASLGYVVNTFGVFDQNSWSPQSGRGPPRSRKPRAWDTFQQHKKWKENEENQYVADAGRVAREMVEKIIDATQQVAGQGGWLGALAGMAAKTVTRKDSTAARMQKKRLNGKGKGRVR